MGRGEDKTEYSAVCKHFFTKSANEIVIVMSEEGSSSGAAQVCLISEVVACIWAVCSMPTQAQFSGACARKRLWQCSSRATGHNDG